MQYPYLELTDGIYWVVRSENYIEGYFHLQCDLAEDEFERDVPITKDWRFPLYQHELEWGREKERLAFGELCGKLLAEDRVVVVAPQEIELPVDCPKCRGTGELIDHRTSESSNCPSCVGTGIKDFAVQSQFYNS